MRFFHACFVLLAMAAPAAAMERVKEKDAFISALDGRELAIGIYGLRLAVSPDGNISGRAAGWAVTGNWKWENGYFCRTLDWGGTEIPFNCQEVKAGPGKMRFTSDQGAGMTAVFRLRDPN